MGTILTLQADATLKQTAKKSQELLYVNRKEKCGVFCEHDQCLH